MKKVIVGHRGVGKSSLLMRHQTYFPNIPHFDLDTEIQKHTQISTSDFFKQFGEEKFRQTEKEVYQQLRSTNQDYVIALGAGFHTENINDEDEVLYVSRVTDRDGRIFLDRPRLNEDMAPLDESKKRYLERNIGFIEQTDQIYYLPEGLESANEIEESLLKQTFKISDAYYTLSQSEILHIDQLIKNYSAIELRTDLIDTASIQNLVNKYPLHQWLVSFRNDGIIELPAKVWVDWDISLGPVPESFAENKIVHSTHQNEIARAIEQMAAHKHGHLKLCPFVENFDELHYGYEWQQADPENRSFVPRSSGGDWIWYRQVAKYLQKINFVRNLTGNLDQPSPYEWLTLPKVKPTEWAAVLGKPVYFSRTPLQHEKFFLDQNTFVTRISLSTEDLRINLNWLMSLGLGFAAVTSPLKEMAYELSTKLSTEAKELKSVNTLLIKKNIIYGHNTDLDGFKYLAGDLAKTNQNEIAVWGGGGTLQMIKAVLPKANYYSSQTARLRDQSDVQHADMKTLIWAAPRTASTIFPSVDFGITQVIDLNYAENSMGLEYAQLRKINYTSGLKMFREQALKQQKYWSSL